MKLSIIAGAALAITLAGCSSTALNPGTQSTYTKPIKETRRISEYIEYDYYRGIMDRIAGAFSSEKEIVEIRVRGVAPVRSRSGTDISAQKGVAQLRAMSTLSEFLCPTKTETTRQSSMRSRFNETGDDRKSNKIASNMAGADRKDSEADTNQSDRRDLLNLLEESHAIIRSSNRCSLNNLEWKDGEVTEGQLSVVLVWNKTGATAARGVYSHMNSR